MYSAFFADTKSAENALLLLMLQSSSDIDIRNHVIGHSINENMFQIDKYKTDGDNTSYKNNQEIIMNQATTHMNQLLSRLAKLDSTKKQIVTESVDVAVIKKLTDKLQNGEITYDQFRAELDSEEYTDHSMRQGERGMQGDDTPAGHRAWDREKSDWDDLDDDDHDDENKLDLMKENTLENTTESCTPLDTTSITPKTPASINMTAASGQELSTMLKDLMSLAGVKNSEPEEMPTMTTRLVTKKPDMRKIIDAMNTDSIPNEGYDNEPASATDVPKYTDDQHAYNPNAGRDHKERQKGLPVAMPVDESLNTVSLKLFQEYKNYISQ
jgi:hypothetical protein